MFLAASSPLFQNLLKRNKHPQPLIYMKGVEFENLLAIVDFLYCGEANDVQENLDAFLSIAEELKLKGLTEQRNINEESIIEPNQSKAGPQNNVKRENSKMTQVILPQRRSRSFLISAKREECQYKNLFPEICMNSTKK